MTNTDLASLIEEMNTAFIYGADGDYEIVGHIYG
jgi:hypothetical protein